MTPQTLQAVSSVKLSPSSFSFLYEGCKRCFYLNVKYGIRQPSMPLPAIFSKMAGLLKNHYDGKRTEELHPDLPPGIISHGEKFVRSQPISIPGHNRTCYLSGRFDVVATFDDGTYGVIDFKTGQPKPDHNLLYGRQLHAYAYALENPAEGSLQLAPVTKLGLLYFYPQRTKQEDVSQLLYEADIEWIETERNDGGFMTFLEEVLGQVESDSLPTAADDCLWCNYIKDLQRHFRSQKAQAA